MNADVKIEKTNEGLKGGREYFKEKQSEWTENLE